MTVAGEHDYRRVTCVDLKPHSPFKCPCRHPRRRRDRHGFARVERCLHSCRSGVRRPVRVGIPCALRPTLHYERRNTSFARRRTTVPVNKRYVSDRFRRSAGDGCASRSRRVADANSRRQFESAEFPPEAVVTRWDRGVWRTVGCKFGRIHRGLTGMHDVLRCRSSRNNEDSGSDNRNRDGNPKPTSFSISSHFSTRLLTSRQANT
jgi:hypothetical protein